MSSLVKAGKSFCVVVLVDSNVVKRAASNGRSSAKPLQRSLCRLAALAIAGGIYMVFGFLPTRWNPADDPTRDTVIRGSVPGLNLDSWFPANIFRLSALPRLRRWASSWARLVMLLCGPGVLSLADAVLVSLMVCLPAVLATTWLLPLPWILIPPVVSLVKVPFLASSVTCIFLRGFR